MISNRLFFVSFLSVVMFFLSASLVFAGGIVGTNQYAIFDNPELLSEGINAVRVNFAPANAAIAADLSTSGLVGQAWAGGLGWIQFSGTNYGVGVNCASSGTGTLNGYAWGQNASWINFGPFANNPSTVTVDGSGFLNGAAWAQNAGWMQFDPTTCPGGNGCVQFDFACPTSGGGGGGGGSITVGCSLSASPSSIDSGESSTISWNIFGPADKISFQGGTYTENQTINVSPTLTTLYTATVKHNGKTAVCKTTVTVDGQPPIRGGGDDPTCQDPEANNYDPSGSEHDQSLCDYTFGSCFVGIDPDCESDPDPNPQPQPEEDDLPSFNPELQCPYFQGFWRRGDSGSEVAKLQDFLNRYMPEVTIPVDGIYGRSTASAVGQFQERHREDILDPWNYVYPTNRWYKTTQATANGVVGCIVEERFLEDVERYYTFDNMIIFGALDSLRARISDFFNF